MRDFRICDDAYVHRAAPLCRVNACGIEVQAYYDPEYIVREPDSLARHREEIADISLRSFHGPFGDLCPGSFDPLIREITRQRFDCAIVFAQQLDIFEIILHHGYIPNTSAHEHWRRRAIAFWKDFLETTDPRMHFHIENVLEREPAMLADFVAAVGDSRVDLCLDIGHAHCFTPVPVVRWIEQLGPLIGYVHLHDNHGKADEHLGLGQGTLPLLDICAALEACAPGASWAVESKLDQMDESLAWLRANRFVN